MARRPIEAAGALLGLSAYNDFAILEPIVGAALGNMGEAVVAELTAALKGSSLERRRVAAYALGSIGPEARTAVPALEKLLRDEQPAVRFLAARALGSIGKDARRAVPRLHDATTDKDAPVRIRAALAVWQIGGESRHVALLAKALRDESIPAREAAAQALATMGPDAQGRDRRLDARRARFGAGGQTSGYRRPRRHRPGGKRGGAGATAASQGRGQAVSAGSGVCALADHGRCEREPPGIAVAAGG